MIRSALFFPAVLLALCPSLANAQWQPDGIPVCVATNSQVKPDIESHGPGGAIVTWQDSRSSETGADIYAQRISASGVIQ